MQTSNVNWNLYKTFAVVFDTANLNQASRILGITRSAVSQNIKELGNQLGITLFTPHSKGVEPTKAARDLYPLVKNAVDLLSNAETLSHRLNSESKSLIRFAISTSSAELFVKVYLKEFNLKYPNARFEISKRENLDLAKQKQLDFVIDVDYKIDKKDFNTIDLFSVTGAFFASKKFMATCGIGETLTLNELFKLPIISQKEVWQDFLKQAEIKTCVPVSLSGSEDTTLSMTQSGIGIGYFCKEWQRFIKDNDLIELKVVDTPMSCVKFVCGYDKTLTKLACAFIDGLKSSVG